MALEDTNPTLIRNIEPFTTYHKIRVRVGRIWRPRAFNGDGYDGLHYLLIDEMGDRIEGIIEEEYCESVTEKMEEGKIYDIYKFHNKINKAGIKLVNHEVQLFFNKFTSFVPINETLCSPPRYGFHLLQFDEFAAELNNQHVLADLYGCVKKVTVEYQVYVKWKIRWEWVRDIWLANLRRQELKVSMWGDPAKCFDVKTIEDMPQPVFVVITSLRVTMYKNEIIGSGGDHSCIVINPHIDEEQEYKSEFSEIEDKVSIIKSEASQQPDKQNTKTVSQLYDLNPESCKDDAIYCYATIARYAIHNGWWYKGCPEPNCSKILKQKQDSDVLVCFQHNTQENPLPCYRVSMIIEDTTNEATVTIMGRPAEQLFGCTCEELVNKMSIEAQQTLPKEIQNTIGQSHMFELKKYKNGELTVKRILSDQQASNLAAEPNPVTITPEKTYERKRGMDATTKALFTSEPKKKMEREVRGATSSSMSKNQNQKKDSGM